MPLPRHWVACALLLLLGTGPALADPLVLGIRGHQVRQELFSVFAQPGESLSLSVLSYDPADLQLYLDGSAYGRAGDGEWQLRAPEEPGLYSLRLAHLKTGERSDLNLFVGRPASEISDRHLNGYRMGVAPPGHSRHPGLYQAPRFFIEVTEDNIDTPLSPHFTLRQFLCKQESGFPKYVALQESLLVLLDGLVGAVREAGYPVQTFGVISGYRTPYYNKRIGNVPNSRHVYGDAMDFFVDLDGDGNMDDLNGDGARNRADVDLLFGIVERYKARPESALLVGGVGRYYRAAHHGGFIHVDTRGYRARW